MIADYQNFKWIEKQKFVKLQHLPDLVKCVFSSVRCVCCAGASLRSSHNVLKSFMELNQELFDQLGTAYTSHCEE